jgi:glucosylceramidase
VSRWSTGGPQRPGDELVIDLGTVHQVQGIETWLTGYVADFPRELTIDLSEDGTVWKQAWSGSTGFTAYLAALADPRNVPLRFAFDAAPARLVRMRQSSRDDVYYWTITELRVMGE